ncbi:Conserved_hypothetical protein [Hexamita inflata]|uniref:Uncharacterized protein n=2 Tax=Hexamita inflata TaxID=28002 RepID=A0AA86NAC0_9EUKA|nr:Conserved hypothetical protein [Hexamita inflata]
MVRRRWIPVQIGLHEAAALRPWMLVPESLVALAAEVRLTYIGVSKTNDHSHELTVPVQKTNQYKRKLSEWDIYQRNIVENKFKFRDLNICNLDNISNYTVQLFVFEILNIVNSVSYIFTPQHYMCQVFFPKVSTYNYLLQSYVPNDNVPTFLDVINTESKVYDEYYSTIYQRMVNYPNIQYVFLTQNTKEEVFAFMAKFPSI